ncbi:hypothetical protein B296_00016148 [Ensete ventricosum]|uniref:C2 NT-type domain-containing protein n=1 Tax=Ensete ventricosum TaxID=4639 RepID=A0A427AI59_ENSVE|nr:hypothetical protein B296_00016148 [Ensete ventricosum]
MEEKAQHGTRLLEELDLLEKQPKKVSGPASPRNVFGFWRRKVLRFLDGFRRRGGSHCVVCLQVHQIDGLPSAMDGRVLVVGWRTKGCQGEHTLPVHVSGGVASFDDIFLHHHCISDVQSMLGSFTVWASLVDAADCDLGTFHVDLTDFAAPPPAAAVENNSNAAFPGKTMSFVLGGVAGGGALRLSVYCRTLEGGEARDRIGNPFCLSFHAVVTACLMLLYLPLPVTHAGQKQAKGRCFSCLPDLRGCIRSSPMTFCARKIPSLRSDHGFITIENLISGCPPINDEDGGFITIEKCGVGSPSKQPPSDHLANTDDDDDDDESAGGPEDEQPCLMTQLDDDEGVENEFLKMLAENDEPWKKKEGGKSLSLSLDLSPDLDLDSLIREAEIELKKAAAAAQAWDSGGTGAALLEKEEHEELMRRWGSTDHHSSPACSGLLHALGSPL